MGRGMKRPFQWSSCDGGGIGAEEKEKMYFSRKTPEEIKVRSCILYFNCATDLVQKSPYSPFSFLVEYVSESERVGR